MPFFVLLLTFCLAGLLIAPEASGQEYCPFPDSVAVADTLDPKGYRPMAVGNVWEHAEVTPIAFPPQYRRLEVVSDTLVAAWRLFRLETTHVDLSGNVSGYHSYLAITDTTYVTWWPTEGIKHYRHHLDSFFNTCVYDNGYVVRLVAGGYHDDMEFGPYSVPATKTLELLGGTTYAHGIGQISAAGDEFESDLVHAVIDGVAYGTSKVLPRVRSSVRNGEIDGSLNLSISPNPFREEATIRFALPAPQRVRLVAYDLLGRDVQVLADGHRAAGAHRVRVDASGWPTGVYLYRLETPSGVRSGQMIRMR